MIQGAIVEQVNAREQGPLAVLLGKRRFASSPDGRAVAEALRQAGAEEPHGDVASSQVPLGSGLLQAGSSDGPWPLDQQDLWHGSGDDLGMYASDGLYGPWTDLWASEQQDLGQVPTRPSDSTSMPLFALLASLMSAGDGDNIAARNHGG